MAKQLVGSLFIPLFFLLQLNLTYMKRILHLVSVKNITFNPPPFYVAASLISPTSVRQTGGREGSNNWLALPRGY